MFVVAFYVLRRCCMHGIKIGTMISSNAVRSPSHRKFLIISQQWQQQQYTYFFWANITHSIARSPDSSQPKVIESILGFESFTFWYKVTWRFMRFCLKHKHTLKRKSETTMKNQLEGKFLGRPLSFATPRFRQFFNYRLFFQHFEK